MTTFAAVRPVADLALSKSDAPDPVNAGTPLTYTITVTNAGPVPAGALTTTLSVTNLHAIDIPDVVQGQPGRILDGVSWIACRASFKI